MHELGITRNIVAIVSEQAKGARVKRVCLEIGQLSAVLPEAIRFCFDVCCQNTPLEGAVLEIQEIPGRARCQTCQAEFAVEKPWGKCPCGSVQINLVGGEEMKIKEMEVC